MVRTLDVTSRTARRGSARWKVVVLGALLIAAGLGWLAFQRGGSGVPEAPWTEHSERESNAARLLVLRVRDALGAPLADCRVLLGGPGAARELGRTDSAGEWSGAATDVAGHRLALRHPAYAQLELRAPETPPDVVELTLQPAATVRGIVRRHDGTPLGPGVAVVAHPAHRTPRPSEGAFAADADPALHVTRTESDGYFELRSLRPGGKYMVSAGTEGWLTLRPLRIEAPSDELELELLPLFGCFVRLRDKQGGSPRAAARLVPLDGTAPTFLDPAAKFAPQRAVDFLAAGIPLAQALDGPDGQALLFCAATDVAALKPMMQRFVAPGYHPLTAGLALERVRGALTVHEFALTPEGDGWTELSVRLAGAPRLAGAVDEPAQALALHLERSDGRRYDLRLMGSGQEGEAPYRVPAGAYRVSLRGPALAHLPAAAPVPVEWRGPRDTLELPWPAGTGALELTVLDDLGLELDGPFELHLREHGALPVPHVLSFDRSPARLPALPVGTWHALVSVGDLDPHEVTTPIEVRGGQATRATLHARVP